MLTVVDAAIYTLLFHRLAGVPTRIGDLAPAAVIAAVAFTLLKIFASELFQGVTRNRFLATFGLIVGLLVWMNLVARVTLVAAALAATIATDRGHLTVPDPAALAGAERSGPVASGARSDGRAAGDADAVPHEHGRIQPAPDPQARRAARVLLLAVSWRAPPLGGCWTSSAAVVAGLAAAAVHSLHATSSTKIMLTR